MHLSIKAGLERAKISLFVTVSTCLRVQPEQRGLQMSVLILTMLLLWPLSQGEAVMLCSSPLGQGRECKYVCQDTQVRDEEGKGSIQGILQVGLLLLAVVAQFV